MTVKELRNIDLNLLVILQTIYEIGHLGKASKKLNITQSAISHSLSRLREFYRDPLFIRTKSGMIPTEFTKKIAPSVKEALTVVTQYLLPKESSFDPSQESREFVLAIGIYFDYILLTDIHLTIKKIAPNIRIKLVKGLGLDNVDRMREGSIHLSLEWLPFEFPDFCKRPFLKEQVCLIINREHPLLGKEFSPEWFDQYPLLCVNPRNHKNGIVQNFIHEVGLQPEKVLSVCSISSIPQIISESFHIGIIPKLIALRTKKYFPIEIVELPQYFPLVSRWFH